MQYWDDILYPSFRATIRGEYYGIITQDDLDEECFNITRRAIATFKFPRISTEYEIFYARRADDYTLEEVEEDEEGAIPHGLFKNDLTFDEIQVLLAWMKVYWCENQLSNADNFDDIYTDANIKTFSRANLIDKNTNLLKLYKAEAREAENRYSRVNTSRKPSLGDVNNE